MLLPYSLNQLKLFLWIKLWVNMKEVLTIRCTNLKDLMNLIFWLSKLRARLGQVGSLVHCSHEGTGLRLESFVQKKNSCAVSRAIVSHQ